MLLICRDIRLTLFSTSDNHQPFSVTEIAYREAEKRGNSEMLSILSPII